MRRLALLTTVALLPNLASAQIVVRQQGGPGGSRSFSTGGAAILNQAPSEFGVTLWRVGQWARYSISMNAGGGMPISQVRSVSVVGQRADQFWVETSDEFGGMMSGASPVRKMLVPFGPMVERVGGETYLMMPDSSVIRQSLVRAATGDRARGAAFPQGWTRGGEEQVSVGAGSFRAVKYTKGAEELWVSAQAGPVGVVRYRSQDMEVELVARGDTGARARVPFGGN